jgi:hypothetical protein
MATILPASAFSHRVPNDLELIRQIVQHEVQYFSMEKGDLEMYRDYYEGEQLLVYGSEKFKSTFGDDFKGFKDNWCGVVVDALVDKLEVEHFAIREDQGEGSSSPESTNSTLNDKFQRALELSNFDFQQDELHEYSVAQGRGFMVVWPNPITGFDLHWNPAEIMRITYTNYDPFTPAYAVKRWQDESGEILVTVYTADFVYKFTESAARQILPINDRYGIMSTIPDSSGVGGSLVERRAIDPHTNQPEPWPLPNPLGVVPVVEFANKRGSELSDVIPQQDAVNYILISTLVAGEFAAFPQRVFYTHAKAPADGFDHSPGKVWRFPIGFDAEGKPLPFQTHEFRPATLGDFRQIHDMMLQDMALTSKTPVRYFMQSDRGGRGDAPSGDSLIVDDQPLLDKVEDRQVRFGVGYKRLARVAALALSNTKATNGLLPPVIADVQWKDRRADFRSVLLEDGLKMKEIGLPLSVIIKKLGLGRDEVAELESMIESGQIQDLPTKSVRVIGDEGTSEPEPEPVSPPASSASSAPSNRVD